MEVGPTSNQPPEWRQEPQEIEPQGLTPNIDKDEADKFADNLYDRIYKVYVHSFGDKKTQLSGYLDQITAIQNKLDNGTLKPQEAYDQLKKIEAAFIKP